MLRLVVALTKHNVACANGVVAVEIEANVKERAGAYRLSSRVLIVIDRLVATTVDAGELIASKLFIPLIVVIGVFSSSEYPQRHVVVEVETQPKLSITAEIWFQLFLLDIPPIEKARTQRTIIGEVDVGKLFTGQARDVARYIPGTVIVAPVVLISAAIAKTITASSFRIALNAGTDIEIVFIWCCTRSDVHEAPRKVTGVLSGVRFLNQQIADNALGHDVERNRLLKGNR